ncbi:sigma-70 family RNA polymerase sigma factor [Solibacillus sp. FSL R7-0682]|uniref:sigma-70 family RNA polymerase sigma factor n=1 Tax=Solibacillus sp. FSL R7-0682 TaxID=2921690 RepID=UPI0030FB858B
MDIKEIKNPLLRDFLSIEEHYELYEQYFLTPNENLKKKIEECFGRFYAQVRVVSYFSKTIHFAARNFDKKKRAYERSNLLYLDAPSKTNEGVKENSTTLKELIEDKNAMSNFENPFEQKLEELILDYTLHHSILTLNTRQKQILYLAYVLNLSDNEIGKQFNVTQQAISKSKNNALKKVRRMINV